MTFTLRTYQGNPRAFKVLIAAEYHEIEIKIPPFEMGKDNKTKNFLAKNPLGKVPVLDTPEGAIFESNAIARYIARIRNDKMLYGKTFFESGQVDQWIDFSSHELEVPLDMWLYPVLGYMPYNAAANAKAKEDVKKALQILENHLLLRTYLVGEQITLADITIASALIYPMKMLLDKDFRKPFSNVLRWFTTLVNQPQFIAVVGDVPLCDKATTAAGAPKPATPKKEGKKDAPKKAAKKEVAEDMDEAPKEKKVEHPLAVLNREKPSSMKFDDWKVCYSNTKPLSKAMEWFWENIDLEGYSIWFCNYNYNAENTRMFMTCNAVSGFIQRSEAMRKYSFGVMSVLGEEGKKIEITGCWLFRGQSVEHILEANPDAEYYTWTKVTDFSDENKAKIAAYWINEDKLEGKPIADSKVFK